MRTSFGLTVAAILCVLSPLSSSPARGEKAPADPKRFEKRIVEYEAEDKTNKPAPGGVLFVGSSSIGLWKTLAADFPGVPVINRGFGGSHISDNVYYADRIIIPYKPKTIVFYAGDNDIYYSKPPKELLADFQTLVKKVHAELPDTRIHYISIKPSIARWNLIDQIREANALIKDYTATNDKLGYIDIFTPMLGADGMPRAELLAKDKLHMTRKGYELWRDVVAPVLKQ